MEYINIAIPYTDKDDFLSIEDTIESGWLTQGPKVKKLEEEFALKHGVKHAIATTSCTTALHLGLKALEIIEGDYVIVPSFTWISTANAVEYCNANVVFCDVDKKTYNITPELLEETILNCKEKGIFPKAVIVVHLFGLLAPMDDINIVAAKHNIKVLEDAACVVGASYKDKHSGQFGNIACYSMHPRKIITTGEGGMCLTDNSQQEQLINCLRNHGASISEEKRHQGNKPYIMPDFNALGYNYRMSDIQASVGISQLNKLDMLIKKRQEIAEYYNKKLKEVGWIITPYVPEDTIHSYQSYACVIQKNNISLSRNTIMERLQEKGIATRPGTIAVHMTGYYKNKYNLDDNEFPNSKFLFEQSMSIPLHNKLEKKHLEQVVMVIKSI